MNSLLHVSERNHSGLILVTHLAAHYKDGSFRSLQEIAGEMHLSVGYLEEIAMLLKTANLIEGRKGPNGGYRLARAPKKITVEEILSALEGPLTLVACQKTGIACPVASQCQSKSLWSVLQTKMVALLKKTTLADLT